MTSPWGGCYVARARFFPYPGHSPLARLPPACLDWGNPGRLRTPVANLPAENHVIGMVLVDGVTRQTMAQPRVRFSVAP